MLYIVEEFKELQALSNSLCRGLKQVKATHIFAEEEVEYEWARLMETVKENLAAIPVQEGSPNLLTWSTPFYDIKVICFNFLCLYPLNSHINIIQFRFIIFLISRM